MNESARSVVLKLNMIPIASRVVDNQKYDGQALDIKIHYVAFIDHVDNSTKTVCLLHENPFFFGVSHTVSEAPVF